MNFRHINIIFAVICLSLISCGEDENPDVNIDEQIQSYILSNGLNPQKTSSGLYYIIDDQGTNAKPNIQSTVIVNFVGSYLSGTIFQSTYDQGGAVAFPITDLIEGFMEGIRLFGRGGSGLLIIPPDLAFGSSGTAGIPPNSVLIFDLVLVDFYDDADEYNDQLLSDYIQTNGLQAEKTESGMYYIIEEPGTDPFPNSNSTITAHYHGFLLDGTVFDSSLEDGVPFTISLNNVIPGWQEGMQLFGTGGKGTLLIPSKLAYGTQGNQGIIGRDAPIIFEIELINVQ